MTGQRLKHPHTIKTCERFSSYHLRSPVLAAGYHLRSPVLAASYHLHAPVVAGSPTKISKKKL